MGPPSQGENSRESSSGKKRLSGESDGGDWTGKKVRIFDGIDGNLEVFHGIDTEEEERNENQAMGSGEERGVSCTDELCGFDLNVALIDSEDDEFVPEAVNRKVDIICIPSDDSEDEEGIGIVAHDVKGKGKLIVEETNNELLENIDFGLGLMDRSYDGNSYVSDGRRYTREEKGKAKIVDSWLSLATNPTQLELQTRSQDSIQFEYQPGSQDLKRFNHPSENGYQVEGSESSSEFARRKHAEYDIEMQILRHGELRRNAHKFARWAENGDVSSSQEKPSLEDLLGKSPGPFSTALMMVRDRTSWRSRQLIDWKPSDNGCNSFRPVVPSLLDLSLKALAAKAEAIVSLELVPDFLRRKLADCICNLRKMDVHTFELFVKGSPTEIRIKDCSWLTDCHFSEAFGNFDAKNLKVLELELCGQCPFTLAGLRFPKLGVLSLKGACRLSNDGLQAFVNSAPELESINLSHCSLLTNVGINFLANSLGSKLRELYIDECPKIDAMLILPALRKFAYLEVLSVAGIHTVSDQFVDAVVNTCGQTLKELDLSNCLGLTNGSLRAIGDTCSGLHSLNISNLDKLTDLALQFLADGCQHIQTLKLCRNKFSDEAIAAFLEASGESLKELCLNSVTSVGPCTAFSLAKCSRKLLVLDLSWCRKLTDKALGLIVDSCLSLKLVKLFGCTQITKSFVNGHSNTQVQIIGLQLTPILENATV
ncbi:uncharacterized protein LOC113781431 isoform X1 [Coffea eugenioides]|uniref:Uncharacterized protein isoform X1 n=1 Tax=Coffea arabica TaxID=13443 RepID=A0A6P6TT36_COFAR|nr:uncharacterized protein LOC113703972 isoform X1 [Coffea arabica]XP_027183166.1 uncharacterized protein LOC113781431 isoform X1 [Coffea eugenioides]